MGEWFGGKNKSGGERERERGRKRKVYMMVSVQTKGPVMMCSLYRTKNSDRLPVSALLTINVHHTHTCMQAEQQTDTQTHPLCVSDFKLLSLFNKGT